MKEHPVRDKAASGRRRGVFVNSLSYSRECCSLERPVLLLPMGPNTKVKEKQCEGTTTEQLLADLTSDFEEAITAQICLSNQLLDANIDRIESGKDIIILKSMESESTLKEDTKKQIPLDDASQVNADNVSDCPNGTIDVAPEDQCAQSLEATVSRPISKPNETTTPAIVSAEELTPITTESAMTASEIEDNIEERLRQLDGAIASSEKMEEENVTENAETTDAEALVVETVETSTPSETSTPVTQSQPSQASQLAQPVLNAQSQSQSQPVSPQINPHITVQSSTPLPGNAPKDFMKETTAGELEDHDIEEVLKALKGLDSTATADTICDLNVLFNEVYTTLNYEEINSSQQGSSSKQNQLKEVHADIEKKQQTIQRKIEFLLRRLRKMQSRNMCKHVSEEISGVFEMSANIVSKSPKLSQPADATDPQQLNYEDEKRHPVSAEEMSSMLRKIEAAANTQQLSITSKSNSLHVNRRRSKKLGNNPAALQDPNAADTPKIITTVVPTYDEEITAEISHVSGLLHSQLSGVQSAIDSDATESSSGGESADEFVTYNNQMQESLPITKRAAWQYSRDRAAIASRWSWLLSQIADLEIKIRQHSELHQEIKRTKSRVVVDVVVAAAAASASASATGTSGNDICSPSTSQATSTPFNGYKAAQANADTKDNSEDSGCCRTRAVLAPDFRKRKLFQTTNIHTISKKAARPSTIKCGCQWPLQPCALCTGRADPTAPRDLPDTMTLSERAALLDPGFHPVLSFREDIPSSIHLEALTRQSSWQQRVMRCPIKNIAKSVWRAEREANAILARRNPETGKRRYIKKKDLKEQQHPANINGTGRSMPSTPLVANRLMKNSRTPGRYHLATDVPANMRSKKASPARMNNHSLNNNNNNNNSNNNNNTYNRRISDYLPHGSGQFTPSPANSSSISNAIRTNKINRKQSSSAINTVYHYNNHSKDHYNNEYNYLHSDSWDSLVTRSRTSSPTHCGSSNYHKYERSIDRRIRTSYDIDNIVIPYSVAATTRVEILPYKEIPTPKWRIIRDNESGPNCEMEEEENNTVCNNNNNNNNHNKNDNNNETKLVSEMKTIEMEKKSKTNNIASSSVSASIDHKSIAETVEHSMENGKCRLSATRNNRPNNKTIDELNDIKDDDDDDDVDRTTTTTATTKDLSKESLTTMDEPLKKKYKLNEELKDNGENCTTLVLDTASTNITNDAPNDNEEDISDEAMFLRHEKALVEERRKFQTYLKFPWSTRSRANRRIDSRAESSGANTPVLASPAPNMPGGGGAGGDLESVPSSPAAPTVSFNNALDSSGIADGSGGDTTATTLGNNTTGMVVTSSSIAPPPPSVHNCNSKRLERRRTTSAKRDRECEGRGSTPDPKECIPPFEPLRFPLTKELYDTMTHMMPANYRSGPGRRSRITTAKLTAGKRMHHNFQRRNNHHVNDARNSGNYVTPQQTHRDDGNEMFIDGIDAITMAGGTDVVVANASSNTSNTSNALNALNDDEASECNSVVGSSDDDDTRHHLKLGDEFEYDPYSCGGGELTTMINNSDTESSDVEPFSDDDPNDPEWKGDAQHRDRNRKKL